MPELVLLKTDLLLFLLLLGIVVYAVYARRHRHLREPWQRVARNPQGMAAAVVLLVYVLIGLLDSIHFYPRQDAAGPGSQLGVVSLFDQLVRPLHEHVEKTYSAPLAVHQYTREWRLSSGGQGSYAYPRLLHGGRHLQDVAAERWTDVAGLLLSALFQGLLCWTVLCILFIAWQARRAGERFAHRCSQILRRRTELPWLVILLVLGLFVLLGFAALRLSFHYHLLGTDKVGQSVLYQALKSIRVGLIIGSITTLIMLPFAVLLGVSAGYFRGWVDDVVQYLYTTLSSIPGVLLIAAAALMGQVYMQAHADEFNSLAQRADLRLLLLCVILGVTSWTTLCRLLRAETLKLRELEYVQSARSLGVHSARILWRHVIPNTMHIVLIALVLDFSALVLAEAVLSYVNIGVDPSTHSWGNMINSARLELAREPVVWWPLASAFVFMLGLVLAANIFSDAVRDAFDPHLRGSEQER